MDTGNSREIVAILLALAPALPACDSLQRASVELTPAVAAPNEWGLHDPDQPGPRAVFDSWAREHGYRCHDDMRNLHGRVCRAADAPLVRLRPRTSGEGYVAVLSWAGGGGRGREEFERHVQSLAEAFQGRQPRITVAVRYDVVAPR